MSGTTLRTWGFVEVDVQFYCYSNTEKSNIKHPGGWEVVGLESDDRERPGERRTSGKWQHARRCS